VEGAEKRQPVVVGAAWKDVGSAARIRLVTDPATNAGWLSVVEGVFEEGFALPFHVHHREDVMVSVLGGEVRVYEREREWTVRAGGIAFLPRRREHALSLVRPPAQLSVMFTPAGFEGFIPALCEVGDPKTDDAMGRLISAAARYGCEVPGEPPRRFAPGG
jgi:quercetin dioxygenase-like cupin family protein